MRRRDKTCSAGFRVRAALAAALLAVVVGLPAAGAAEDGGATAAVAPGRDAAAADAGPDAAVVAADGARGASAAGDAAATPDAGDAAAETAGPAPAPAPEPQVAGSPAPAPAPEEARIAEELARAEQVQRAQASLRLREELAARQRRRDAEERRARIEELGREAREADRGSQAADALLQRVMAELQSLRPEVDAALLDLTAAPAAPRLEPPREPPAAGDAPGVAQPPEAQRLAALRRALSDEADTLEVEARRAARERAEEALGAEEALDGARELLLARLSDARRDEVLGVDREGMDQLRAELWHTAARARWYGLRRDSALSDARAALRDPFYIAAAIARGGLLLAVILAALLLARRRQRLLDGAQAALGRVLHRPRLLRGVGRAHAALSAVSGPLLFLAALVGVHAALGPTAARARGIELGYSLLLWYALYRLALAAARHLVASREASPGAAIGAKLLRSLQTVARYTLAVQLLLALAEGVAGRGYLHHAVGRAAWLGAIPLALLLMRRWRDDICEAYLRVRVNDAGPLAEAVRATRRRWYGFFVAIVAFVALALAALSRTARRFLLGFESSHRVLAFLFRRRLERRKGALVAAEAPSALPEELLACLPEQPIEEPARGLDHYPDLDQFEGLLATWRDSAQGGSLLLVGGAGSGKTSWLRAAEHRAGEIPCQRIALRQRLLTEGDVVAVLGAALDAPRGAREGAGALAAWLRTQPRRLFIVDDLEHLFLRGLDTWGAWEAFLEIVEHSTPRMFWLCAIAEHPYRYLLFARGGAIVFRTIVQLAPWPEPKLGELLGGRVRASGFTLSFDDLLLDEDAADRQAYATATERDYNRLIWDYSQGSPRVALHYWLRSLRPAGDRRLRVQLFRGPSGDDLEELGELERFVLASVVWHDSLTTEEASISLGFPRLPCENALSRLVDLGVIDDLGGRHRVTTRWQSAVTTFLLRKHLIQP
ncbi:hypothetical protein [Sorangium sp. So ce1389]|uniref:hypothetical protein n=1 Tax=Sorangium sp. So ce1389 TaxID=3133336 RepID=UPI003F6094EA